MGEDVGVSTRAATGGAAGAAAAGAAVGAAAGGAAASPAVSALDAAKGGDSLLLGALLVAKSTVTLRVDSGAIEGRRIAGGAGGLGPESNSGTTSTMSATKIDAPIRRSLRRRSITI